MRGAWILLIGLASVGCREAAPRIDTTSDETASASLKRVKASLPVASLLRRARSTEFR